MKQPITWQIFIVLLLICSITGYANHPGRSDLSNLVGPDLTFSNKGANTNGGTLNLSIQVTNSGDAASGDFKVGFYASENDGISVSDILIADPVVSSLAPGENTTVSVSLDLCELDNLPNGDYFPGIILDYEKVVAESEEGNNNVKFPNDQFTKDCASSNEKANLTINGISFEVDEDVLTLSTSVENLGTAASGSFKVGFYATPVDNFDPDNPFFLGETEVSDLAPGAEESVVLTVDLCSIADYPGTETVSPIIIADHTNQVDESDETDNMLSRDPYYGGFGRVCPSENDLPDLYVLNKSFTQSGNIWTISATIGNSGKVKSGTFDVGFYASDNASISKSDFLLGSANIQSVPASSSETVEFTIDLCSLAELPNGTWYPGIIADYLKVEEESEEGNNNARFEDDASVKDCSVGTQANLAYTNAAIAELDGGLNVDITVENIGDAASGDFVLSLYLSEDASIETSDYTLRTFDMGSLAPGASESISLFIEGEDICFGVIEDLVDGSYFVGSLIDSGDAVNESDETDNVYVAPNTWQLACGQFRLPELGYFNEGLSVLDDTLRFTATVTNFGYSPSGDFKVGFYLSNDDNIGTNDQLIGVQTISSLDRLDEASIDLSFILCELDLEDGNYFAGFILDYLDEVDEAIEGEGSQIASFPDAFELVCPAEGQPNLSFTNEAVEFEDDILTFALTVLNTGTAPSGDFYIGFYASDNSSISVQDLLIGSESISSLEAGEQKAVSISVSLCEDDSLSNDPFIAGFILDYTKVVDESDESDNNGKFTGEGFQKTCPEPELPNLTIGEPTIREDGFQFFLTADFINTTEVQSGPFITTYYLSEDESLDPDDIVFYQNEESLGLEFSSSSSKLFNRCDLGIEVPDGEYHIIIKIDSDDQVVEANEEDNVYIFREHLEIMCFPDLPPNLRFVNADVNQDGNILTYSGTVINDGIAPVGEFQIGLYISDNASISTTDILLDQRYVYFLGPGETYDFSVNTSEINVCLEDTIENGTEFFAGMIIDHLKEINESDEGDNNASFPGKTFTKDCTKDNKPDLNFTSSSVTQRGDFLDFTFSIKNKGDVSLDYNGYEVGFYASENSSISTSDQLIGVFKSYTSLGPDEKETATFSINMCLVDAWEEGATRFVGMIADYRKVIDEFNEGNNNKRFVDQTFTKDCPQGDLANLSYSGANFEDEGTGLEGGFTVGNSGAVESGDFVVQYFFTLGEGNTRYPLRERTISSLAPGENIRIGLYLEYADICLASDYPPDANYQVGFTIDINNEVEESDETDNEWSSENFFETFCDGERAPELVYSDPRLLVDGNTVQIDLNVINASYAKAPTGDFELGFFVSDNSKITTSDQLIGRIPVSSLEPDDTVAVSFSADLCEIEGLENGIYFLGFVLDVDNVVDYFYENSPSYLEDMRIGGFNTAINKECIIPKADLVFSNEDIDYTDNSASYALTITNQGGSASGPFKVGYYASPNTSISVRDYLIAVDEVASLEPGESIDISETIDLCETAVVGTTEDKVPNQELTLGFILDYEKVVDESDESNNNGKSAVRVVKSCASEDKRNLAFENQSFSVDGNTVSVSLMISNRGEAESGEYTINLFASEDSIIEVEDFPVISLFASSIPPGEAIFINYSIELCGVLRPQGPFYLGQILDPSNHINETDETDNAILLGSEPMETDCPPNIQLDIETLAIKEGDISISGKVSNTGDQSAKAFEVQLFAIQGNTVGTDDVPLETFAITELAPGEVRDISYALSPCGNDDLPDTELNLVYRLVNVENPDEVGENTSLTTFDKEEVCRSVSIASLEIKDLRAYPNPFRQSLTIEGEFGQGNYNFQLSNLQGQPIKDLDIANPGQKVFMHLQEIPEGLYFMAITDVVKGQRTVIRVQKVN